MGIRSLVSSVAPSLLLVAACGGGNKTTNVEKPSTKPIATQPPPPPVETEEDRAKKRHAAAVALIPPGTCLPASLKEQGAPRLELAAVSGDAILCALDTDTTRMLGPVACWKIDLKNKTLSYQEPAPIPGRDIDVLIDDRCNRGFCLPADAKLPGDRIAHMAWSIDGSQVAMLAGDDVHIFDDATKAHRLSFSIRGDKGVVGDPSAVHFVSDSVFVEASDGTTNGVWVFKTDGTQVGPITALGAKESAAPVSTKGGSFSILDKERVAIAEQGFAQMTVFEVATGKRTKAVRRAPKVACKPAEIDTFFKGGDKVTDKCREGLEKEVSPWIGADAIAGHTNLLVVMRGERTGDLAVVDPHSLAEDRSKLIKLPWCDGGAAAAPAPAADGN